MSTIHIDVDTQYGCSTKWMSENGLTREVAEGLKIDFRDQAQKLNPLNTTHFNVPVDHSTPAPNDPYKDPDIEDIVQYVNDFLSTHANPDINVLTCVVDDEDADDPRLCYVDKGEWKKRRHGILKFKGGAVRTITATFEDSNGNTDSRVIPVKLLLTWPCHVLNELHAPSALHSGAARE